jgi:hypothetical protein
VRWQRRPLSGFDIPPHVGRSGSDYRILSYLIVYQAGSVPLLILGVHGKRNVARLLRQRL